MDHVVSPDSSIQATLDVAQPGERIVIPAGLYYERLTITTPHVTLAGEPGAILHGGDRVPMWTAAPDVGAGVWQTTTIGYQVWALTLADRAIWRINNDSMNGQEVYGCQGDGNYYLTRPATGNYTGNVGYTVTSYWDGIEALFGSRSSTLFVRFRGGDDPNTLDLYAAPTGGTILIDDVEGVTIAGLTILGGENQVWIRGAGAHHNTLDHCQLSTGRRRVLIDTGAHDNTVQYCSMACDLVGFGTYQPGEWERNTASYDLTVKTHLYNENKFIVGRTTEDDTGVYINAGPNNHVLHCHIARSIVGVHLDSGTDSVVAYNRFEAIGAQALFVLQGAPSATIHHNQFADAEHHVRIQNVEQDIVRTYYFYHNTFWQPRPESQSAKHLHASFLVDEDVTTTVTSPVKIYAYHNSFAGGGWALDIGASNRQLPHFFALNNLISTRGIASSGGTSQGKVAYNWMWPTTWSYPDQEEGNVTGNGTRLWDDVTEPDFAIPPGPYGDTARLGALDLSQPFVLDGVTYPPLPGMTHALGFFGAEPPGVPEPPDPPEPATEGTKHVATRIHHLAPGTYTARVQVLQGEALLAENTSVPFTVPSGAPPTTVDIPVVSDVPGS